jgi:hypothetical protein
VPLLPAASGMTMLLARVWPGPRSRVLVAGAAAPPAYFRHVSPEARLGHVTPGSLAEAGDQQAPEHTAHRGQGDRAAGAAAARLRERRMAASSSGAGAAAEVAA